MSKSTKLLKALTDIDEKFLMEDYKISENENFEEIGDDEKMDKSNLKKFSIKKCIIAIISAIAILAATPVLANTIQKMLRTYSYGIETQEEKVKMDYINKDGMFKYYENMDNTEEDDNIIYSDFYLNMRNDIVMNDYMNKDDNIKIKVKSFNLTEDLFSVTLSILFSKDTLDYYNNLGFDDNGLDINYIIYDENKNVYNSVLFMHPTYTDRDLQKILQKELGVNVNSSLANNTFHNHYTKEDLTDENIQIPSNVPLDIAENEIIYTIKASASEGFPKSKKIYIKIFGLSFECYNKQSEDTIITDENREYYENKFYPVSTNNWDLEIDIPDSMYKTIELKLKSPIKGFKVNKLKLTSTGLSLEAKDKKLENFYDSSMSLGNTLSGGTTTYTSDDEYEELVYITDGDGTVYISRTTGPGLKFLFDVTEEIWKNKKLYLNVKKNGEVYTSELIED